MNATAPRQMALFAHPAHTEPPSFEEALAAFETFPYARPPFAARNWGHPLHSLCSYPSKMKPALASTLVRLFTEQGDAVLDPFAGVGTIPFEAASEGRRGLAIDLSPFAFAVSAGKVDPPTSNEAAAYIAELADYVASGVPDFSTGEGEIEAFFHPDTWAEVLLARHFSAERDDLGGRAHWFVKAAICHILHGNRPYALSRRSHGIIPIPPKGPTVYKSLLTSLREKVARMRLDDLPVGFTPGEAMLASALDLPLPDRSIDAIITSPPFLKSTEFIRQNRLRLWFCGMDYQRQLAAKSGGEFIENHKTLEIYERVLREFRRVLRPGGLAILHLGVVQKHDMALAIVPHAENAGLRRMALVYEDAGHLETHGRTSRGGTAQHEFLFLRAD
jgi:SAM-dependent methyltransferase